MDAENLRKKLKTKNILIALLVIAVITLTYFDISLYKNNSNLKREYNKLVNADPKLTEREALLKGKELYDKATEIYTVYSNKIPYCGLNLNEINGQTLTKFEDELIDAAPDTPKLEKDDDTVENETSYYKSKYKDIKTLKRYLANYLSEDLIENNIKSNEKVIKDLILLTNETYTGSNYVSYENSLYCKATIDEKFESRYLANYTKEIEPYDMRIVSIDTNKISFLVKSKYLNDKVTDFNKECKENIDSCINTNEKAFTIEKVDGNWIVTVFKMHE